MPDRPDDVIVEEPDDADADDAFPPAELLELFEVLEWNAALEQEAGS